MAGPKFAISAAPAEIIGSYRDGRLRLTEARSQPHVVAQQSPARRGRG